MWLLVGVDPRLGKPLMAFDDDFHFAESHNQFDRTRFVYARVSRARSQGSGSILFRRPYVVRTI
jgi:hypothetical protein